MAGALTATPCAAQDLVSFSTEDGGVVFATLRGAGEHAVVFAHGGRFTKESWDDQTRAMASRGFLTLALDFRGRGESRGGPGADSHEDVHLDVLAAVRFLQERGARSISLICGSFGGGACARASTSLPPGAIDRMILLAHSAIEQPERMQGRKLFVTTRDDFSGGGVLRLPSIRDQYERAPDPKELVVLEGSAHAQHIFATDQGPGLMDLIIRFMTEADGDAAGAWEGEIRAGGARMAIRVTLENAPSGWSGTVSVPSQYALEYGLGEVRVDAGDVTFTLPNTLPPGAVRAVVAGDRLDGDFTMALGPDTLRGVARFRRASAAPPSYTTRSVRFRGGDFELAGTSFHPGGDGPHPGVVLIHGSGPQTRESYIRWFADAFAGAGFAALIYDKRGTGESSGARWPETPGSFTDLADDALAAVRRLAAEPDVDAERVGVWGFSQGAWIAPLAATRAPAEVRFAVLLSGGGVSPAEQELYDDEARLRRLGFDDDAISDATSYLRLADEYIRTGGDPDWVRFAQARDEARREPWYVHLDRFPQSLPRSAPVWSGLRTDLDYDPAATLTRMAQPTLLILGEEDELTPALATAGRIQRLLREGRNPELTVHLVPGADHGLMFKPTEAAPWVAQRPAPGWVDAMLAWLRTVR